MRTVSRAARRGRTLLPKGALVVGVLLAAAFGRRRGDVAPAPAPVAPRRHFPTRRHTQLAAVTGLLVATLVVTGLGVVVQRLGAPRSSFVTRAASAVIPGPSRIAKAEASDSLWSDAPVAPAAPAAPPTVVPPSPATAPAGPRAGRVDRLSALAANLARTSRGGVRGAAMWPLNGPITGPFLERRGSHRHPGVDISAPIGTPVPAAAPGRVILAGPAPSAYSGYGILVIIDHGNGDISMYAHLSRVSTHVGEAVATGDVIGLVGATGRATGPHLHFEVRRGNAIIDPVKWVAALLGL